MAECDVECTSGKVAQKPSAKTLQNLYRRVFAEVSAESAHHAGPVFVLDGERYADTKRFNLAVDHDPNALAACLDVLQRKGGVAVEFLAVRRKQECAAVFGEQGSSQILLEIRDCKRKR